MSSEGQRRRNFPLTRPPHKRHRRFLPPTSPGGISASGWMSPAQLGTQSGDSLSRRRGGGPSHRPPPPTLPQLLGQSPDQMDVLSQRHRGPSTTGPLGDVTVSGRRLPSQRHERRGDSNATRGVSVLPGIPPRQPHRRLHNAQSACSKCNKRQQPGAANVQGQRPEAAGSRANSRTEEGAQRAEKIKSAKQPGSNRQPEAANIQAQKRTAEGHNSSSPATAGETAAKKTFLGQNKSFWGPLELVEKFVPEAAEITASVKDLPGLKTPVGRGRAWLRLALMQKKLSEYMKALVNRRELLSEFYEPNALMMEEEGVVIAGLLVGLNVIDANFCMKGEDLDSQVGVIDFSMYLKDGTSSKGSEGDGQITAILDQKNYVEELNRHLSCLASSLPLLVKPQGHKQDRNCRIGTPRVNVTETVEGGNAIHGLDVEKELEVQIGMRQEMELAMRMLEKDVCEKQDALVALRQQLDDLRALKHELSFKLQSSDLGVKQKSEINSRLEEKTNQMAATIKQLEQRLQQAERERQTLEEDNRLFKLEFGDKIDSLQLEAEQLRKQRSQLEQELKRSRDRLSPSRYGMQENKSLPSQGKDFPKTRSRTDSGSKLLEEDSQRRTSTKEENAGLPIKTPPSGQEDHEQTSGPRKSQPCQLCQEESTRNQKKNVCKNCGGIFCEACSANEIPLPSSINPERVCDRCHKHLMQQYSASPS
ncbi:RUN and FYVE domain-containing protein 2-like [Sphaerodactylus townsendi]|uniref:RUN and FYVE domain-containing protein 2-like n=1 Tax=Sphaerodactylus townsendi TaxID=933632 RepID=UPI0020272E8E|nr:RUN and FYVE domain-containing protein 2-like [Sphaerodactylus townsendi]